MIEATTIIEDVKQDFEGGNSLSLDWDTIIRRAVENVLDNVRPETLKRRVPIYGGLAQEVYMYYCPADVLIPSDLYTNDGLRKFSYVPPMQFYKQLNNNTYTIEYINGARFLVVRHDVTKSSITIDAMEALGTKTGGSAALNQHNFLVGSASIEAIFTDAGVTLTDTLASSLDISDHLKGVVLLPSYIPTADNLSSIKVRLISSTGNYYEVTSTADSIGDYFVDGWNIIKFDMANKTTTGSPVSTAITKWEIIGTTTTGTTLTIIFDKFTIQNFVPYYLEYYSDRAYISGSTGAYWQSTISNANADKINFNRDVAGILHYEICMLVTQSSTFDAVDGQASTRFAAQLKRKYLNYNAVHPSSEAPLTYSKSPEIDISLSDGYGQIQDNTESLTA
jgi:hypothetical protein